ncbi:MAG: thioredoxin fold domain-containing protein [Desulfatiglans sp.]|jgi:thiol:disulfide interchange protein DsbD|nr:thioredoxin fold domain-containing protein [Desulfatiglans sp.]
MKNNFLIILLIYLLLSFTVEAKTPTVSVEVIHSTDRHEMSKSYPVLFRLTVASGWYIHGTTKEDYLIPTALVFTGTDGISVENIEFPLPEKIKFEYTDRAVDVYAGTFYAQGMVKVEQGAATGLKSITGELSYQACSKASCLAPETIPVEIELDVVTTGTATNQINQDIFLASERMDRSASKYDSGILWAILWIFLGGLALNLTPCVYPLIPITVSYFGGRENRHGSHTILLGILYISGLAFTNSILGVTAALTGGILGAALQYPVVLIIIALIMFSLGLSFFGLWEIHVPGSITKIASKNFSGYFGTFFMGLTLGIVAAPCLGPFVLGLLTYVGQKGDPFIGFLYFFVLSIGIGLPLCLLAIFSSAIDRLPMSGDWMLWVKKVMGWVMIFMGYYFLSTLIKNPMVYYVVFGALSIIAAIHLGWLDKTGARLKSFSLMKKTAGVLIILAAGLYLFTSIDLSEHVKWIPYNETLVTEAKDNKKPVILDVYADWCLPCRHMEKTVFNAPEVVELSKRFITLRLDITRKQPKQESIRKLYSIDGAPTIIFFDKDGKEIPQIRIEAKISAEEFLEHMKKALGE